MKKGDEYYLRTNLNRPVYIRVTPTGNDIEIIDQPEKTRHYYRQSVVLRSMLLTPAQRDEAVAKKKSDDARRRRWKQEIYDDGFTLTKNEARDGELSPFDGAEYDDDE